MSLGKWIKFFLCTLYKDVRGPYKWKKNFYIFFHRFLNVCVPNLIINFDSSIISYDWTINRLHRKQISNLCVEKKSFDGLLNMPFFQKKAFLTFFKAKKNQITPPLIFLKICTQNLLYLIFTGLKYWNVFLL